MRKNVFIKVVMVGLNIIYLCLMLQYIAYNVYHKAHISVLQLTDILHSWLTKKI